MEYFLSVVLGHGEDVSSIKIKLSLSSSFVCTLKVGQKKNVIKLHFIFDGNYKGALQRVCMFFFSTLKYGRRGILNIPITNSNQSLVFVVLNVPWNLLKRQLSYWVSSCQMCSACGFSLPLSSALHPVGMICLNSKMNFNTILWSEMRLPVLSCCFCNGRNVNAHVLIFYD